MFYSKSTGGFYCTEVHGAEMPLDVVEITDEYHQVLLEGQSKGMVISSGEDGIPLLSEAIIQQETTEAAIQRLEASVTPRRLREAVLGNEESRTFILDVEEQIKKLRSQL